MLARGFALDFKGIHLVGRLQFTPDVLWCPDGFCYWQIPFIGATFCVLSLHQIRSLRSHSFTLQVVITPPNVNAPMP